MLTAEEKQLIADKMGWCLHHYASKGKLWGTGICTKCKDPLPKDRKFSLSDAGLVRDWLVERGEWKSFRCSAEREAFDSQPLDNQQEFTAWLFATENGEATNFFRIFAEWAKE